MKYVPRIVCLTEETTETIYLLGAGHCIAGISGFTLRPPEARKTKPCVSTYLEADFDKIESLRPDWVFAWSDLQADIVRELVRRGIPVIAFNQRSVSGILEMIETVGLLTGKSREAKQLATRLRKRASTKANYSVRPKVLFEEWGDPIISCGEWVDELITTAGGVNIFHNLSSSKNAAGRIVTAEQAAALNPDIIIGSWCGKKFNKAAVTARPGWQAVNAVQHRRLFEIPSSIILQPGPAALTEGLDALVKIIYTFSLTLNKN